MHTEYFTALRNMLRTASEQAFSQIREQHPDEDFYAFALNTDDSVMTAVACANSEQAYQRTANGFEFSTTEPRFARWNVGDWAYEAITTEFSQAADQMLNGAGRNTAEDSLGFGAFSARVHQTMIEALQDLEAHHFWGTGEMRAKITVFVSISDSDMAEQLENTSAQKLNPIAVYERFLARYDRN